MARGFIKIFLVFSNDFLCRFYPDTFCVRGKEFGTLLFPHVDRCHAKCEKHHVLPVSVKLYRCLLVAHAGNESCVHFPVLRTLCVSVRCGKFKQADSIIFYFFNVFDSACQCYHNAFLFLTISLICCLVCLTRQCTFLPYSRNHARSGTALPFRYKKPTVLLSRGSSPRNTVGALPLSLS